MAKSRRSLSEDAGWIARRVFATLSSTYTARGTPLQHAINQAAEETAEIAAAFDHFFATSPPIDVSPDGAPVIDVTDPAGAKAARPAGFMPGIENFKPAPKAGAPNGGT